MVEPFDGSDGSTGREGVVEIDVWACNVEALAVFRACTIACVGAGMGGVVWLGITASETRAALAIRRVARRDWPDIAEDVRHMGAEVAHERNRQAEARAKRGG